MASEGGNAKKGQTAGMIAGGGIGAVAGGPAGAALGMAAGGAIGGVVGGMFDKDEGPDYSPVTAQFAARNAQIGEFSRNLASARAKYLSSLNNMYNTAYARFSGNAEAGFANRGMSVSGGAFASALARKSAEFQSQLEPTVYQAESNDLKSVDNAYGANSAGYMSAISGGPALKYGADRQDSRDMGGFVGKLGLMYAGKKMGLYDNPNSTFNSDVPSSTNNSIPTKMDWSSEGF